MSSSKPTIVYCREYPTHDDAEKIVNVLGKSEHVHIDKFNDGGEFVKNGTVYFTLQKLGGGYAIQGSYDFKRLDELIEIINNPKPAKIPAHEFLQAGAAHMKDRAEQRDGTDGERSMSAAVNAFNALEGVELTETQGWRFMCLLKLSRSAKGEFVKDDYEDLAAYGGLAGEAASETLCCD